MITENQSGFIPEALTSGIASGTTIRTIEIRSSTKPSRNVTARMIAITAQLDRPKDRRISLVAAIPPDAKKTPENMLPASTIIRIIAVMATVWSADRNSSDRGLCPDDEAESTAGLLKVANIAARMRDDGVKSRLAMRRLGKRAHELDAEIAEDLYRLGHMIDQDAAELEVVAVGQRADEFGQVLEMFVG